jgi:hypothetical protein
MTEKEQRRILVLSLLNLGVALFGLGLALTSCGGSAADERIRAADRVLSHAGEHCDDLGRLEVRGARCALQALVDGGSDVLCPGMRP